MTSSAACRGLQTSPWKRQSRGRGSSTRPLPLRLMPHSSASRSMSSPMAVRRTSPLHQVAEIKAVPQKSSRRCSGTCQTEQSLFAAVRGLKKCEAVQKFRLKQFWICLLHVCLNPFIPAGPHTGCRNAADMRCRPWGFALHSHIVRADLARGTPQSLADQEAMISGCHAET